MQVIIADDTTGAGDSGVHFAASGRRVALLLSRAALGAASAAHDMAVLSTETRFMNTASAARELRAALADCRAAGAEIAYKKIDSTLRGNPGAEIGALMEGGAFRAALVCPAMPKTGRVIRDGRLFINGRALDDAQSGSDPFNPVPSADVSEVLAGQTGLCIMNLSLARVRAGGEELAAGIAGLIGSGAKIIVADAETDGDLAAVAAALRRLREASAGPGILPVGAGGFAEAMAGPAKRRAEAAPRGRLLAVVGSLTKISLEQTDHAAARGFRLLELDTEAWAADPGAELARLASGAGADGAPLLLRNRVAPSGRIDVADGIRVAGMFAASARAVAVAGNCGVLYATGGSTAMAVLQALGVSAVTLERECMPGVVMSSFAPAGTKLRRFISKAGGFGGPDTIARIAEAVHG